MAIDDDPSFAEGRVTPAQDPPESGGEHSHAADPGGPASDREPGGTAADEVSGGPATGRFTLDDFQAAPGSVTFAGPEVREQRRLRARRIRRRRRWIGRIMFGLGIALLLASGWVAFRFVQAERALTRAAGVVDQVQTMMADPEKLDSAAAASGLEQFSSATRSARSAVDDPVYRLATGLPWLGDNLGAVRVVGVTADELSARVVPPLLTTVRSVSPAALVPRNGRIDPAPIATAASALAAAEDGLTSARAQIAGIQRVRLVGRLAAVVDKMGDKLAKIQNSVTDLDHLAQIAPAMLGATTPRHYLVVFENLAEPRATGGIFGDYLVLTADNGKLTVNSTQAASRSLGQFSPPLTAPAAQSALYGELLGQFPGDVNLTPDFPSAARMFARMYTARTHAQVDGVISIDPVALSYLLEGSPAITLADGTSVTAGSLVKFLLSDVYAKFPESQDSPARDLYLAAASKQLFQRISGGGIGAQAIVHGLVRATREGRFKIYSADADEQAHLTALGVTRALVADPTATPDIGVYADDGTGAKLGYYLTASIATSPDSCRDDGTRQIGVSATLTSTAPATGLPPYVLGLALGGPYVLRLNVLLVAPAGGSVVAAWADGRPMAVKTGVDQGRPVGMVTVDLKPKQKVTVTALVTSPPRPGVAAGTIVTPTLSTTPGIRNWSAVAGSFPACRVLRK